MRWIAITALYVISAGAAELKRVTVDAFNQYIRESEDRIASSNGALWADQSPGRADRIRGGQIAVEPFTAKPDRSVAGGGLIHDWVGSVFIPGATIDQTIALVQDY